VNQQTDQCRSSRIIGVVADDITGANDIGIMFALSGFDTCVYPASQPEANLAPSQSSPDVCILNTNSRLDSRQMAYHKVYRATLQLKTSGFTRFFKKTCSVFRGNIGAEFDAMLDALGLEFAIVVLGYPKNGRTTINGTHFVHGRPLAESEFRADPIHPMLQSNLVNILQAQTKRKVENLPSSVIAKGVHSLRSEIARLKKTGCYIICDVSSQDDLHVIANAVWDEPVLCGSSALAEVLPAAWNVVGQEKARPHLPARPGLGVLCISGSLMPQTAAQIDFLVASGAASFELDSASLSSDAGLAAATLYWVPRIAAALSSGQDVVFHGRVHQNSVELAYAAADTAGLTHLEMARRISNALAEIGVQALHNAGQNRLVVAGGETSDSVCHHLSVQGLSIWKEIEPGLPSCLTLSDPPYLLALKSGSFGTPAFLAKAVDHLKNIRPYL
jgi:uncharacterized protein YgbK (DUF1537 family)